MKQFKAKMAPTLEKGLVKLHLRPKERVSEALAPVQGWRLRRGW